MEENRIPRDGGAEENGEFRPEPVQAEEPGASHDTAENEDLGEDEELAEGGGSDEAVGATGPDRTPAGGTERAAKKKKKRILITVIAVVTALSAVYFVWENYGEQISGFLRRVSEPKKKTGGATMMYSDELISYIFYPTNYSLDPTQDEVYMGLDRQLWYHNGAQGVGISLEDENYDDFTDNDAVKFFVKYFRTVIAGDTDTYNTYFTDRYYRTNDPHLRFAPQMLYDIHVHQLSNNAKEDGTSTWTFNVEYKIHRNDGTFRNDIPSDGSRKLLFTLVSDRSGEVRIDAIDYYRTK